MVWGLGMTEGRRLMGDFLPIQALSKDAAGLESSRLRGGIPRQERKLAGSSRSYTPPLPAGGSPEILRIQSPSARLNRAKRGDRSGSVPRNPGAGAGGSGGVTEEAREFLPAVERYIEGVK
jgi:hypothetical protein